MQEHRCPISPTLWEHVLFEFYCNLRLDRCTRESEQLRKVIITSRSRITSYPTDDLNATRVGDEAAELMISSLQDFIAQIPKRK